MSETVLVVAPTHERAYHAASSRLGSDVPWRYVSSVDVLLGQRRPRVLYDQLPDGPTGIAIAERLAVLRASGGVEYV